MRTPGRAAALLTISLGTCLVACEPGTKNANGIGSVLESAQSALTNATIVTNADLFWQSTVEFDGTYLCTGSIISPRHILMAAHCVPQAGNYVKFYNNHGTPTPTTRTIAKVYQEAVYMTDGTDGPPVDNHGYIDDWAVAYLTDDIPAGYFPAQLATTLRAPNSQVFEVGVSGDNANIPFGRSMRYVATTTQTSTQSHQPCQSTDQQETGYCKGTIQAGVFSVDGDSGGPLFTYANNAKKTAPLTVHGDLLGGGTYTSVSQYFDKIMASTGLRLLPLTRYDSPNVILGVSTASARDCAVICRMNSSCQALNYDPQNAWCELFGPVESGSVFTTDGRCISSVKIATGYCAGSDTLCPVAWCQSGNNMACGGTCPLCSSGLACTVNSDCVTNSCVGGVCSPAPVRTQSFKRYVNASGQHWVTTAPVPAGFNLEGRLGFIAQTPATGTHALYGCQWGTDYYISKQTDCEGATVLRLEGYAYDSPTTSMIQLYRCMSPSGHFVSVESSCEGSTTEGSLGYLPIQSAAVFYGGDGGNTGAGNWDSGYWKATCDLGDVAVGLSKPTDFTFTHALLCKNTGSSVSGAEAGLVDAGTPRRYQRVPVWDNGFTQLECGLNESVTGASQNLNPDYPNTFHALRCSAGAGSATNCETRLLDYGAGYIGAWGGDWDYSYLKSECPTTKVVVGVSLNDTTLRPHAIYCCDR